MIRSSFKFLRRFRREEDGQMLVEFAIALPLVFTLFLTSVEMGIYSMRQMFLDRGMDMTVRQIRLTTGTAPSHANLKQMICDYSGFLEDCDQTLRLEMDSVDPRGFAELAATADCVDTSLPVTPLRKFKHGQKHEMMLLRACYRFKPVFKTSALGHAFSKDGSGRVEMYSTSVFVQEPDT